MGAAAMDNPTGLTDPLTLTPSLWLKADGVLWKESTRATPAIVDGDLVGAWDDASGNGFNVIQATGGKLPVLKLGVQNSKPVIRFDGVNDCLVLPAASLAIARNISGATLVVVARSAVNSGAARFAVHFSINSSAGNSRCSMSTNTVAGLWSVAARRIDTDTVMTISGGVIDTAALAVMVGQIDYSIASAVLRRDRVPLGANTKFLTPGSTTDSDSNAACIGSVSDATSNFWSGDIGEVMVFRRALNNTEQANLESYLKLKWGTP